MAGAPAAIDAALAELTPHLQVPVNVFEPEKERSIPAQTDGTLVLVEVSALNREQQVELLEWLDAYAQRQHVQVVSTTSRALFSLVERGEFLAQLYYRLNVLRLDLEPPVGQA